MFFSVKLKELRKEFGYKQQDLAQILNVSQQTIAKWESGKAEPGISTLIKLSKVFNCLVDDLIVDEELTKETPLTQNTEYISTAIDKFRYCCGEYIHGEYTYSTLQYVELILTALSDIIKIIPQPQLAYFFLHISNLVREIDHYVCEIKLQKYNSTELSNPEYKLLYCAIKEIQEIIDLLT